MIWSAWRRSRRATMSPSLIVFTRLGSARMASINRASVALSTHGGTTRIAHGKSFRAWAHTRTRKDIRQDEGAAIDLRDRYRNLVSSLEREYAAFKRSGKAEKALKYGWRISHRFERVRGGAVFFYHCIE